MPFTFDSATKNITMAAGDTATITVNVSWDKLAAGDVLLFALFDSDESGELICKPVEIANGTASIRLCNHDTRDIPPGRYRWTLRLVTSPAQDTDGSVRADECSDEVITLFNTPPCFIITRGGAYV